MLILILQRQEDISSRLGNLERHLSSSNHHLPLNIPHQSYTPYLPSIIPLILLILLIHHYLLILYPHPLYLHVIKLTTLQHQHLQKKTYKTYYNNLTHLHLHLQLHLHAPYTFPLRARSTFTEEDLQDLLQQFDTSTSTSTTTSTCPLHLPLRARYVVLSTTVY